MNSCYYQTRSVFLLKLCSTAHLTFQDGHVYNCDLLVGLKDNTDWLSLLSGVEGIVSGGKTENLGVVHPSV